MNYIDIYTLDRCPYCDKAKELLKEHDLKYYEHDISRNDEQIRSLLGQRYNINGRVTVPQTIINGKHVGGYTDLKELFNNGRIKEFLD